jgi:hypothetical protein
MERFIHIARAGPEKPALETTLAGVLLLFYSMFSKLNGLGDCT